MNQQVQNKIDELIPDKGEQERLIDFAVSVGLHMMDKGFILPERWGLAVDKLTIASNDKAAVFAVAVTTPTMRQQADPQTVEAK